MLLLELFLLSSFSIAHVPSFPFSSPPLITLCYVHSQTFQVDKGRRGETIPRVSYNNMTKAHYMLIKVSLMAYYFI